MYLVCVYVCAQSLQFVWLFVTLRTVARQAFSVQGVLQARILVWVAVPSSRGSSWPRDRACISYVSYMGRWVLYHWHCLGSPSVSSRYSLTWSDLLQLIGNAYWPCLLDLKILSFLPLFSLVPNVVYCLISRSSGNGCRIDFRSISANIVFSNLIINFLKSNKLFYIFIQ